MKDSSSADPANRHSNKIYIDQQLNLARAGFVYRGGLLWNHLPDSLTAPSNTPQFKKQTKCWVKQNVTIKPG